MAHVAAERGIRRATVRGVLKHAGISSATFYVLFRDLDDCFLALLEDVLSRSTTVMFEAFEQQGSWSDGAAAGLAALLVSLDAEPARARVCLTESLAAGAMALELRARKLQELEPLVDAGRDQVFITRRPLAPTAESTVASIAGILHNRVVRGDAPPFIGMLDELVSLVLGPWLDAQSVAASVERAEQLAREISQQRLSRSQAPVIGERIPSALHHPRAYRARACVLYLADCPGASNQIIADAIGVNHHAQISALLKRLGGMGLLVKYPGRPGHPHAWRLSPYGNDVALALESDHELRPVRFKCQPWDG